MSKPLTPYDRWLSGTNQNSIPANDNSLRDEIFNTDGIADDVTAQPGSPDDGDWYIIPPGATGTQWATFAEESVAIFYGGTWYEFVPAEGNIVTVEGDFYIYGGSGGWQVVTIPTSSPADEVSYDNTASGLTATDVQAAIDELALGGVTGVQSIVAGTGISVDDTDPANPIVSATGGGGGSGDVVGPASSGADRIAVFDGTTGKLLKDGGKTIAALRVPSVQSVTSAATVTPTFADDAVKITAQAASLTLANPTGTGIDMHGIVIRIKDNGTAQSIAYGTQYRAIGITLPTTTVLGKTTYIAAIYNADDATWDCIATGTQA